MEELWRHKQSDALRFLLRVYVHFVALFVWDVETGGLKSCVDPCRYTIYIYSTAYISLSNSPFIFANVSHIFLPF